LTAFQDQQDEGDMAPQFLTRFYDQTLTEGVPAELQCLIDGRPMPTIKWLFNDIEIIPSDNLAILQDKNLCSLCIKEVKQKDLGTYTCNLKNALGVASCSAGLNVLNEKIKNVPVLPKFLKKISDQNMRTGEGVTFEVVVIGEPPPKVVWQLNHKPISVSNDVTMFVKLYFFFLIFVPFDNSLYSGIIFFSVIYSMWTKVIPFPPSSLYISYKTTYFPNILMKSFLSRFS
jgi:hypothetical protein